MANVIYAVYGKDIECPGMVKAFFKKEDAEELIKNIKKYEAENPKPKRPPVVTHLSQVAEWDAFFTKNWAWKQKHPLSCGADKYEEYFISEIEVN